MGASESQPVSSPSKARDDQFVLIATAPPGVGKESLMGTFISRNPGKIGYCAMVGAVKTQEKGLLYNYESIDDTTAIPSAPDTYPTVLQAMQAALSDGKSVIVDTDVAGVRRLRAAKVPGVYVFVLPQSIATLAENLEKSYRGRPNAAEEVSSTLAYSEQEILALDEDGLYDYGVQNDSDEDTALKKLADCLSTGRVAADVLALPPDTTPNGGKDASGPANDVHAQRQSGPAPATSSTSDTTTATAMPQKTVPNSSPRVDSRPYHYPPGMERWRGKVAVVTGATSGIGWATCKALALAGMRVVAAGRRRERLEALQAEVLAAGGDGRQFLPIMCDITKEGEVRTLMSLVGKTFGGRSVSVLINNAGCARSDASLMRGSTTSWVEMVSTNVLAVAICCREAIATMRASGDWGHIINVSSLAGHRVPNRVNQGGSGGFYAGTKHAVCAMTEGLRQEARAEGVPLRVSMVSPGIVHTEFHATMSNHDPEISKKYQSMPGLEARDIADSILYMLSTPQHMEIHDVLVRPTEQVL